MSHRDDLEAALARINLLQADLARFQRERESAVSCPACRHHVPADNSFCGRCGTRIHALPQPSAPDQDHTLPDPEPFKPDPLLSPCPKCGQTDRLQQKTYPVAGTFCVRCGTRVPETPSPPPTPALTLTCPRCGAPIEGSTRHCSNCSTADPFAGADMASRDLSGTDLSRGRLCNARLSHANLTGAKLVRADLSGASLLQANVSKADLRGADLKAADCRMANFAYADLRGANLDGAQFDGASLHRTIIDWPYSVLLKDYRGTPDWRFAPPSE